MSLFKNTSYSVSARWIFTMNGPPLENHYVNVVGRTVDSITTHPTGDEVYDFDDQCTILPGTVNMHAHLELSGLEAPLDGTTPGKRRSMAEWIRRLLEFRRGPHYDARRAILSAMLREDVLSETVAVADIVPWKLDLAGTIPPPRPVWRRFPELIGWSAEQAAARLSEAESLSPSDRFGLAPHAPHTVCAALLDGVVALARREGLPVAMHLAESPEERRLLETRDGPLLDLMRKADPDYRPADVLLGRRPLDYLQLLAEAPRAIIIHGNNLDDGEIDFLAERRDTMSVVYCPRSHDYFGYDPYPLRKMLDRGVRVLIGTDSLASTPNLSVLGEMRCARRRHPDVPPETIFRMGTLDGASELGLGDEFGVLRPGAAGCFAFY